MPHISATISPFSAVYEKLDEFDSLIQKIGSSQAPPNCIPLTSTMTTPNLVVLDENFLKAVVLVIDFFHRKNEPQHNLVELVTHSFQTRICPQTVLIVISADFDFLRSNELTPQRANFVTSGKFCALALWLHKSKVQSYLFRIARKIFAEHFRTSLCSTQHYHPTTLVSVACNFRQIYTRY